MLLLLFKTSRSLFGFVLVVEVERDPLGHGLPLDGALDLDQGERVDFFFLRLRLGPSPSSFGLDKKHSVFQGFWQAISIC
jgi:hypothetical protein